MNGYPCNSCIKTVNSCYFHNKIEGCICEDYKQKTTCDDCIIFETIMCINKGRFRCVNYRLREEKPMENKVQMTEEEYKEIFWSTDGHVYEDMLLKAKEKGYIRKSPAEEAEELFQNKHQHDQAWVMSKMNDAIQYLKAENERLKK